MNRRELLRLIPAVAVFPAFRELPNSSEELVVLPPPSDELRYRGFLIQWVGWRTAINEMVQVGVWFAANPNPHGWHVYSAYPGRTSKAFQGQMLDLSCIAPQELPAPWATLSELSAYRQDAFERLIRYIGANYEELTHAIR